MADSGCLTNLLEKHGVGDKEATEIQKDLKRKLNSLNTNESAKKAKKTDQQELECEFCCKS